MTSPPPAGSRAGTGYQPTAGPRSIVKLTQSTG